VHAQVVEKSTSIVKLQICLFAEITVVNYFDRLSFQVSFQTGLQEKSENNNKKLVSS